MKNTESKTHSGENSQRPVGLLRGRLRYGGQAWLLRHQGVHHGAGEGVVGWRGGWWGRGRNGGVVESGATERDGKRSCRGGKGSNAGEKWGVVESVTERGGKGSWGVVVKKVGEWW